MCGENDEVLQSMVRRAPPPLRRRRFRVYRPYYETSDRDERVLRQQVLPGGRDSYDLLQALQVVHLLQERWLKSARWPPPDLAPFAEEVPPRGRRQPWDTYFAERFTLEQFCPPYGVTVEQLAASLRGGARQAGPDGPPDEPAPAVAGVLKLTFALDD